MHRLFEGAVVSLQSGSCLENDTPICIRYCGRFSQQPRRTPIIDCPDISHLSLQYSDTIVIKEFLLTQAIRAFLATLTSEQISMLMAWRSSIYVIDKFYRCATMDNRVIENPMKLLRNSYPFRSTRMEYWPKTPPSPTMN